MSSVQTPALSRDSRGTWLTRVLSPVPRRGQADPTSRRFGAAIREARHRRGETLDQVAHRIATMDPKYLGEIERGWHAPTIPTAKRIADALDVPLTELVRGL